MDQKKRIMIGGLVGVVLLVVLAYVWFGSGGGPAVDTNTVEQSAQSAQEQAAQTTFSEEEMKMKPRERPKGIGAP